MTTTTTTRIVLASRPTGVPAAENFRLETADVPDPAEGQVLARTIYLSLDPYVRGRMGPGLAYGPSTAPIPLGAPIAGGTVCEVLESRDAAFNPGDIVLGSAGWQTHALQDGSALQCLDPAAAPVTTALGVLGMPGFTAYAGLHAIGRPKPGETVVVAAATGPVGSMVGQLAKLAGCRAVGIAGGPEKTAWLHELGWDAAVDHRAPSFEQELEAATPDGIDIYFENVGGRVLEAVVPRLNPYARVPVCGLVSDYNGPARTEEPNLLPAFMSAVLSRFVTVQGFPFTAYVDSHHEEFLARVGEWVCAGTIRYREDVVDGLENAPEAFSGLLSGANFGKLLVRVSADPTR